MNIKTIIKKIPLAVQTKRAIRYYVFLPFWRFLIQRLHKQYPARFENIWSRNSYFPKSIRLSLSTLCPAQCIFCPSERGLFVKQKIMRLDLLARIIDEAAQHKFSGLFSLGENGEALTNPSIIEAVQMIRQKFLSAKIVLFSNMILMDERYSEELLRANINVLHINLDGNTDLTYGYVKGRQTVDVVKNNIQTFFRVREKLKASCQIIIGMVPAKAHVEFFEHSPIAFPDDRSDIENFCNPFLQPGDLIKDETNVLLSKYQIQLNRVKHEPCDAFDHVLSDLLVAPDGRVYICCRDFRFSSNLGNIYRSTIADIWSGQKRKEFIKKLYLIDYIHTDVDCKTCLPYLGLNEDLYFKIRRHIYKESKESFAGFL